jgi:hypothetical protein
MRCISSPTENSFAWKITWQFHVAINVQRVGISHVDVSEEQMGTVQNNLTIELIADVVAT